MSQTVWKICQCALIVYQSVVPESKNDVLRCSFGQFGLREDVCVVQLSCAGESDRVRAESGQWWGAEGCSQILSGRCNTTQLNHDLYSMFHMPCGKLSTKYQCCTVLSDMCWSTTELWSSVGFNDACWYQLQRYDLQSHLMTPVDVRCYPSVVV